MKKTVNKLRFILLLGFLTFSVTAWSQRANIEKMSVSTQMFLDQMEGKANFDEAPISRSSTQSLHPIKELDKYDRPFAKTDTIDGKVYMSSFVTISDESGIAALEKLGAIIQCTFEDGLLTALIPIDRFNEVADLRMVTRIEVAVPMQPYTDKAREDTNVDDVLSLTADAVAAGLSQKYDGSGVIMGIIDTGIDFQHIAFKDSNGNSRIKRAYVYNGSSEKLYKTISSSAPTTDDTSEDHGTHTSSAAGGSSVIINGSNVTVTNDHASATYGGMAPGADLYLAGINGLSSTYLSNAFKNIAMYADSVNMPLVVSNSWGSHIGPHDGTSSYSSVIAQYFGDNHPNRICLFSAGNTSGDADANEGGGKHLYGTASQANPLRSILRSHYYSDTDNGYRYNGDISAWCRSTSVASMGCRIHVLNSNTGAVLTSVEVNPTTNGASVSGLSSYYTGTLFAYKDYLNSNKTQILLRTGTNGLVTTSHNNYVSNYTLAVEFYPTNGTAEIDVWGGNYCYFTDYLTTNGYNWTNGTDDGAMGDYATIPEVISVGAHVTKNRIVDYNGTSYNYSSTFPMDDIAYFSSYGTPSMTPTGGLYPWITAPGARTVAAVNHYHTSDSYNYINGQYGKVDRVNSNTTYPYGAMQGTSMSTPVAAGIVALWLQAAQEVGWNMTTSDVKDIMRETAKQDSWTTTGPNASHFGNGKIDALGGIQYILGGDDPIIRASLTELTYTGVPGESYTQQVVVTGRNLIGPITATLSDPDNVFSMSVSGANSNGQTLTLNSGDVLNVTYSPHAVGTHTGTITLTSNGATSVTILLNGTAANIVEKTICDGNVENYFLPIFGYFYDEKQINQIIYPAELLTEFQGKTLKSMTFYSPHIYFSGGSYNVKVGSTSQSTYPSDLASIVRLSPNNLTIVASNQAATPGGTTLTINFDENNPFIYDGGNLLLDFEVTETGNYDYSSSDSPTYFYGVNQSTYTGFNSHAPSSSETINGNGIYTTGSYCGARAFLPKVTIVAEIPQGGPSLSVDPTEVNIEDGTGDDRSTNVTVTSENLTGGLTTTASNSWNATLNQDNSEMTVTYNGKALHQMGSASVHSYADNLHASVATDYLYTGPIYILGNINPWTANNGIQMSRDTETGIYTTTLTAQNSGDGYAYVGFTKRLGGNANDWNSIEYYRFGPMSNDANWALYNQWADNRDVYCPLDTVGGYATIQVPMGTWRVTIDSHNNRFKFTELVVSSSVSPSEGTLDFGTIFTGGNSTQTITITNDGNLPFTPSIGGLSGEFSTDYVPSELAPGESVTITITYTPENSGSDSGTFTLSDGVHTYTWTLVGAAVTPVIHGYVEPNDVNVNFGEKALNETYTYTVRIYNDGDLAFDPAINVSGMDGVFNVTPTTGITIEPGEYYDLTVSFTPTQEGSYSSTFTVTINGEQTTVTVTGSASATAITDDIIHSNTVTVPVYKTEIDVYGPYSFNQVENDVNRQLTPNATNGALRLLAKNEEAITGYRLFHNRASKNNDTNWADGNDQSSVAYALHGIAQDNFTTYTKDGSTWTQDAVYPINGANELWIDLNDNDEVLSVDTWYAPVIVANSKKLDENTYGSRMEMSPALLSEIQIIGAYDDSKHHRKAYNDPATGIDYVYVTAQVEIIANIPTIEVNGHSYECYMARAWRQYKPYTIGQGEGQEIIELIDENTDVMGATGTVTCIIGSKDWTEVNADSVYQANEYTFIVKDGEQANVKLYGRIYFKRTDVAPITTRGASEDGGYYAMEGESNLPGEPTYVDEYIIVKEVAEVIYVNPQGMTSHRPFDGVNIVVTRFTDGSTMTSKVLKR
ncbi:MAG: S8 family serine peptidase [Muribaculaceae bacterium]|nr:S8 family serine peptidase [Muribaculaceae bacterium]